MTQNQTSQTANDRHKVNLITMTQYCYSPDCLCAVESIQTYMWTLESLITKMQTVIFSIELKTSKNKMYKLFLHVWLLNGKVGIFVFPVQMI